jgi:ElaB/YqjD/DUF883 family membrane-anchored ribosome-binding protein
MSVDDDARKCCEDIEEVRNDAERVRKAGAEGARKHLANFDSKFERFLHDARDVRQKLDAGIREGLEGLVTTWRERRDRLRAHLRLIEAEDMLASAQRLAKDQYYVAAESELTSALKAVQEAGALLPAADAHLSELVQKIERATQEIKEEGQAAAARLESIVETNERLLAELEQ